MKARFQTDRSRDDYLAALDAAERLPRPASRRCGLIPSSVSMLRHVAAPDETGAVELKPEHVSRLPLPVGAVIEAVEPADEETEVKP